MSANQLQELTWRFLKGGFVNADTDSALFDFLENNDQNVALINNTLGMLGLKLAKTANERTWFPSFAKLNDVSRPQIEQTVAESKKKLRHFVTFLRLTLAAMGGGAPAGGLTFRASSLSDAIHSNANLHDSLKHLCSRLQVSNDTIQAMTNAMLKWAERNDLIVSENMAVGEYRFTGKVDWINDMIASLDEFVDKPIAGEDSPTTMRLF